METKVFEHQVITQLKNLAKTVYEIKEDLTLLENKIEAHFLSEEDKKAIDMALEEEKEGKLAAKSKVFSD